MTNESPVVSSGIGELDWQKFQDFCADVLELEGFEILRRSGVGPDRGADILVQKRMDYGPRCARQFKWLVQCKHRSRRNALRPADVGDFLSDLPRHKVHGYWLMTNVRLSTGLEDKIASADADESLPYRFIYCDAADMLTYLQKHRVLMRKYCLLQVTTDSAHAPTTFPYKDLQPYDETDSEWFFGRTTETESLLDRIYRHRVLGLFGESGTGKTSLIRAGLVPRMRCEALTPLVIRCLDDPVSRMRRVALNALRTSGASEDDLTHLASASALAQFVLRLQDLTKALKMRLVVVIDQLEELFTKATEHQREELASGLLEASTSAESSLTFLLSLREDYIGELWEWSHKYGLDGAWINTYRIARLSRDAAMEVIQRPTSLAGVTVGANVATEVLRHLEEIGDGMIYPPYLQLVCGRLLSEHFRGKRKRAKNRITLSFYRRLGGADAIIAHFLGDSMLEGLSEREKLWAQQVLDLLTGPRGLRAFLTLDDISRYVQLEPHQAVRVVEHLTQKKVVHPVVEKDILVGYELVHDFLSLQFFESLSPQAKKVKAVMDVFRRACREWKQYDILCSKDHLEMFREHIKELMPNTEEYVLLLKSSLSVYWGWDNKWLTVVDRSIAVKTCIQLIEDEDLDIAQRAVQALGQLRAKEVVPHLKRIITSPRYNYRLRRTAVGQLRDDRIREKGISDLLEDLIRHDKDEGVRTKAVDSLWSFLRLGRHGSGHLVDVFLDALRDGRFGVRAKAVDALCGSDNPKVTKALLNQLREEISIAVRRKLIYALGQRASAQKQVRNLLQEIADSADEDLRVRQDAASALKMRRA